MILGFKKDFNGYEIECLHKGEKKSWKYLELHSLVNFCQLRLFVITCFDIHIYENPTLVIIIFLKKLKFWPIRV